MEQVATLNITVEGVPVKYGQVVETDNLPAGCVESMRRLGQLVDPDEFVVEHGDQLREADDVAAGADQAADDAPEGDAWLGTPIADLKLPEAAADAIAAAGLATVGDLVAYGADNGDSLQQIEGIGPKFEKLIRESIVELIGS
jgi:hypothetical protein